MLEWLHKQPADSDVIDSYVATLFSHVRFAMMTSPQLAAIETSEFFSRYRDVMQPFVNDAHRFRSLACEVSGGPRVFWGWCLI